MHNRLLAIAAVALIAAGCAGSGTASQPSSPTASGLGAPTGYRIKHMWHANLTGNQTPSVVVSSVGPRRQILGNLPARAMDLRILTWNDSAHRWRLAWDAQKAGPRGGKTPWLLDPNADGSIGPVRFVHLLSQRREQLVFSASNNYFGSGIPMSLAVVDLKNGRARLAYSWGGQILKRWDITGDRLEAQAMYWTSDDPHCCPVRPYRFTVAARHGKLVETGDDRPWLGVAVHGQLWRTVRMRIVGVARNSPAAGRLRVGDVILKVINAPRPPHGKQPWTGLFDQVGLLRPGSVARLLVERNRAKIRVDVKLGSERDAPGYGSRGETPSVTPI